MTHITLDIVLVGAGVCVFWIPYVLLCWMNVSSLAHWFSLICFPVGLFLAKHGMAEIAKRSIHVASVTVGLLNLLGAGAFLLVASQQWIEPEIADMPGSSGGAGIAWAFTAVPIFLGFGLLDLLWILYFCLVCGRKEMWRLTWAFLPVPALWVVTLYFDNLHHCM